MDINIGRHFFSAEKPLIMGILNLTPDSFFDGGSHNDINDVLRHCDKMLRDGADIVDIGAFSSRPGMNIISEDEETMRLLPSLVEIRKEFPNIKISIDTFRKNVAEKAIDFGADIINDISGGTFDNDMLPFIGENHIPYIMMHSSNDINNLHCERIENNVCQEVKMFFERQLKTLSQYGEQNIVLDPGIGFNKSTASNFKLLKNIKDYRVNNLPVLIGISRKSMIYKTLGSDSKNALNGTTVLNTIALLNGANILRVHDVKEAVEIVKLLNEFH